LKKLFGKIPVVVDERLPENEVRLGKGPCSLDVVRAVDGRILKRRKRRWV